MVATIFQTRPVPFIVHAIVTNSDLEFDVTDIDFGHCTIYESAKASIKLTNKSILPQEFGFLGLPEVRFQPHATPCNHLQPPATTCLDTELDISTQSSYQSHLSLVNDSDTDLIHGSLV